MDRFSIALGKVPLKKAPKVPPDKAKSLEDFVKINNIGSTQDWITAFNSMIDPEVDRAGIRLSRNKGTDRGRSFSNRKSNQGKSNE